jgi:leader peptidase (prepilin peptidase)/N-methyltransferase
MIYYWFIIGAAIGSFLNVCIYRLPRGESIVFPSSYCPNCRRKLLPLDLIPILGYLFLRGRCRFCKERISLRYPLVEIITGALFSFSWWYFQGHYLGFSLGALLSCFCIVMFFIDLDHQLIPDVITIPGMLTGLVLNYILGSYYFVSALLGVFAGFVILYAISRLGSLLFRKEAMGEGDWLAAAFLGAFLGWQNLLIGIFLGFVIAGIIAGFLLLIGKARLGEYLPFGPALTVGGMLAFFFGNQLLAWYFKFFI